jgi:hypothetical protein
VKAGRTAAISLLLLILGGGEASAQGVYLGVLGGVNKADLEVDVAVLPDVDFFTPRTLAAVGGVIELELADRIAIRLEPMYMRKGARLEVPLPDFLGGAVPPGLGLSADFDLKYFELPIQLNVAFLGGPVQPYVLIGPSLGLLFEARVAFEDAVVQDIEEQLKLPDVSLNVGGGINITFGRGRVFAEGRYSRGLMTISEEIQGIDLNARTRGVQVLGGVMVRLGG